MNMNAKKRGQDTAKSRFAGNRLFGAFGHVHNPFSTNSRRSHCVEAYRKDNNAGELGVKDYFEAEMARIEAGVMAQNLIARFQKS